MQDHSAVGGIWSNTCSSDHIPVPVLDGRILRSPQTHQHDSCAWREQWGLWLRSMRWSSHFQQPMDPTGYVPHIRGAHCILCCNHLGECCPLCWCNYCFCVHVKCPFQVWGSNIICKILEYGKCLRWKK
jgi:hypothetical protein